MAGHHQTVDKVQTGQLEDITKNAVAAFFK
jgi:hypothetical protein